MRAISIFLVWLIASAMNAPAQPNPLRRARQCIVVRSPTWSSPTGELRLFERAGSRDEWKPRGGVVPVVLGKKGLAWGKGAVEMNATSGPRKIEGDNKATAGIFRVGPAFGYAPARNARWIKLAYVPLTKSTEGVDDPRSRYYNRLVDRSKVARVDWHSSEQMLRADDLYKWGLFVAHNPAAEPGAGSCIFLHIWKNSSSATAGCTAMPERNLVNLLRWLDPNARPLLVQLPQREYDARKSILNLPTVR
jgi:D-alanyl-D-alanine dipeptidase